MATKRKAKRAGPTARALEALAGQVADLYDMVRRVSVQTPRDHGDGEVLRLQSTIETMAKHAERLLREKETLAKQVEALKAAPMLYYRLGQTESGAVQTANRYMAQATVK